MKYLLWDFDGTLGYREGMWAGALAEVLQRHDIPATIEHLRPYLQTGFPWHRAELVRESGISADAWWRGLNPIFENAFLAVGADVEHIPSMIREVRTTYCDLTHWKLFDDTIPTLEYLARKEWRHILLSNHVPELLHILRGLHISHYFEYIFNSAETGCEKPHPRAFHAIRDILGTVEDVWMIGDSYEADVAGAEAAGIRAVLVRKNMRRVHSAVRASPNSMVYFYPCSIELHVSTTETVPYCYLHFHYQSVVSRCNSFRQALRQFAVT